MKCENTKKQPPWRAVAQNTSYNTSRCHFITDDGERTRERRLMIAKLPVVTIDDIVFVCIGTDRSTGDALGPLVGTYLTDVGYTNVVGTIDDPCHAENLYEKMELIDKSKTVIAIDACLGQPPSVGRIDVRNAPIKPGSGVNKVLPPVGDYSITGIVNIGGFMEYLVLQNTRLSVVMRMARDIVSIITDTYPLNQLEVAVSSEVAFDENDHTRQ